MVLSGLDVVGAGQIRGISRAPNTVSVEASRIVAHEDSATRGLDIDEEYSAAKPARRHWPALVGVCIAVTAITAGALFITHSQSASEAVDIPRGPTQTVKVDVHVSEYGVGLDMRTSFAEDVTLTKPGVMAGETEGGAYLWPLDGVDHEGEDLETIHLPRDTPVSISGGVRPPCEGDAPSGDIVFSVHSVGDNDEPTLLRFVARNPEALGPATKQWCDMGVTVSAAGGSLSADGDAKADVTVINPGPGDITVEIPAFSDAGATWLPATATVPAGETAHLEVKGSGVTYDGTQDVPWEDGRLLINGEAFTFPTPDGWLG